MIATWKAGGIMVSVSPMLKHKELKTQLSDSGAAALITLESLWHGVAREVVPDTDVRTVITTSELDFLDELPSLLQSAKRHRDDSTLDLLEVVERHRGDTPTTAPLGPDDVAFLTYTSGTTGPSKGAMNSQRNVVFTRRRIGTGSDSAGTTSSSAWHRSFTSPA
jgi:long-chain acyl-CoA synthetase